MIEKTQERSMLITASLVIIAMVHISIALIYAKSVLIPFTLAIFVALLVSPAMDFLIKKFKLPSAVALALTIMLVITFLFLLYIFFSYAIQTIVATADNYSVNFIALMEKTFEYLKRWGIDMDSQKLTLAIQERMPKIVTSTFGSVMGFFSSTIFVCIFVLFLLIGYKPQNQPKGIYADIIHKTRRYITTKTIVSIITGLLVWLTLSAFGLQLAPVFGVMAFLLNFIPSIGSIIATLLPLPIAFAQFQNPWLITFVILIPGSIQISIGNIIEPKLMGKELSLHPAAILLALSFWGLFWGVIGMFLAVPITAIIRIILMQFDSLKPIGNLLAGKLPPIKSTLET